MKWHKTINKLPPTINKWGESDYLLCASNSLGPPFVGWYNSKTKSWCVSHHICPSIAVSVSAWRELPNIPKNL